MMRPGENFNHPKRGSSTKVEPIKKLKDVKTLKELLSNRPRDYCLFVLGINTNLRVSDLLRIKAGMVRHLKPSESFELKEKKTGKQRRITLNRACVDAVQRLLGAEDFKDNDPLFRGKGRNSPLTVPYVSNLVKSWCKRLNLPGNYGAHTLRKTWGYMHRKKYGTPISLLQQCFNHSSEKQTFQYLCIQPEEIEEVYEKEI